jgi:hypothetical protein
MSAVLYGYLDESWCGGSHRAVFLSEEAAELQATYLNARQSSAHGVVLPVSHTGDVVRGQTVYVVLLEAGYGGERGSHRSFSSEEEAYTYADVIEERTKLEAMVWHLPVR